METDSKIPVPFQFNPLKHHFGYIRDFASLWLSEETRIDKKLLIKEVKRIGSSVMDVYTGSLSVQEICTGLRHFLESKGLCDQDAFSKWAGTSFSDFRTAELSDNSVWMLKFHNDAKRFVHLFPARLSPHSFRVKANTLKSAILYYILIGKDFVSGEDLNKARKLLGLSPVKTAADAEAITEMIEVLRDE
ncbi:MAG: hypothetical protein MUE74_10545 [Bacteroidales bacterium]|jgi:hypothetical protein|nr:hypothetical protein [Bacteroidales bacterium]